MGISWDGDMKWFYAPYRSLKPYKVYCLELVVQTYQSASHEEIGEIPFPQKATANLDNNIILY